MFNFFKSKKEKNKDVEVKSSTSQTTTDARLTSVQSRTTIITKRVESTKYEHNTFPSRSSARPKSPKNKLFGIFNSQPTISDAIKKPINPNYSSPYRTEVSKDAVGYNPRQNVLPSVKGTGASYLSQKSPTTFYAPSTQQFSYNNTPFHIRNTTPLKSKSSSNRLSIEDMDKEMKIYVKTNSQFYDTNNKVPTYPTHGKRRGSLLLINNILFNNPKDERKGAEVDEKNLKSLFSKLNFNIEDFRNLKRKDMVYTLQQYSKKNNLKNVDINLIIIMSHGDGDKSGVTKVYGTDDQKLSVSEIVETFNSSNCPNLKDKPKIFMFMCCRGADEAEIETDAVKTKAMVTSDMLLAYSTVPGFVSYRNSKYGTFYTQALCKIFMEHACDTHIEDMLKMVDYELGILVAQKAGRAQTSSYENRGFKLCYLHPQK